MINEPKKLIVNIPEDLWGKLQHEYRRIVKLYVDEDHAVPFDSFVACMLDNGLKAHIERKSEDNYLYDLLYDYEVVRQ